MLSTEGFGGDEKEYMLMCCEQQPKVAALGIYQSSIPNRPYKINVIEGVLNRRQRSCWHFAPANLLYKYYTCDNLTESYGVPFVPKFDI